MRLDLCSSIITCILMMLMFKILVDCLELVVITFVDDRGGIMQIDT